MTATFRAKRFRYDKFEFDPSVAELTCQYSLDDQQFIERIQFSPPSSPVREEAILKAARWVFFLAGVSYYKTGAPERIEMGEHETTDLDREFLKQFILEGLGEFAYKNSLDLSNLVIEGKEAKHPTLVPLPRRANRPLIPFGGGIDSIVTAESMRGRHPDASLFIVSSPKDRNKAIEAPAAISGLRIERAERSIDSKLLDSVSRGFLNGHVPVTGIISAIALTAAVLSDCDAVVMSNEWSASIGTVLEGGGVVNHQWSKGIEFERGLRSRLQTSFGAGLSYYSFLRPYSELWVAQRFAKLSRYHCVFRSCNKAFFVTESRRSKSWCGVCDKCAFINVILAPYLKKSELEAIFDGAEPLANKTMEAGIRSLVGEGMKPFECVGERGECQAAIKMAAGRSDRKDTTMLQSIASGLQVGSDGLDYFGLLGEHFIPQKEMPHDALLV